MLKFSVSFSHLLILTGAERAARFVTLAERLDGVVAKHGGTVDSELTSELRALYRLSHANARGSLKNTEL